MLYTGWQVWALWIFNLRGLLAKFILILQERSLKYYSLQNRIQSPSLPLFLHAHMHAHPEGERERERGGKKKSLKMKRNTSPSASHPPLPPPLSLSVSISPHPFSLPHSVISGPLKQHLLQSRSSGAPSWCSVHSCVIQCQLPASHSAPLMCKANKAGCLHPPRA